MMIFKGDRGVQTYRAVVIKHALQFYMDTGLKVNRAYTPGNMLKAASHITGKMYKQREYAKAISDLGAWLTNFGATE